MDTPDKLIYWDDLKVKHLSGEYANLPYSPEPDDIIYWCKSSKKKQFKNTELVKVFGEEKSEIIDNSIESLLESNNIELIEQEEWIDPKKEHWFYHESSDSSYKDTYENGMKSMESDIINHLGICLDPNNENEGNEILEKYRNGEKICDGTIIIKKYKLLKYE